MARDLRTAAVIPAFGPGPLNRTALAGLGRQTEPPDEAYVIIDDGCPASRANAGDQGPAIPLIIYNGTARTLPAARNLGFRAAQTDFVLPLDDDDRIAPTFLEKTRRALAAHPQAAFAYTWVQSFGAEKSLWQCPRWDLVTLLQQNICASAALVRRSCWDAVGGYSEDLREGLEDWDLWLKFAGRGWYGVLVPEPLFFYRRRPDSMLSRLMASGRRWEIQQELIERHRALYEEHLPEVVGGLARRAFTAENNPPRPRGPARRLARRAARAAVERGLRLPLPRSRRVLYYADRWGGGGLERVLMLTSAALRAEGRAIQIGVGEAAGAAPEEARVIGRGVPRQAACLLAERPAAVVGQDFSPFQLVAQGLDVPWIQMLHNCPAGIDPHWKPVIRRRLMEARAIWAVSEAVRAYTARALDLPEGRIRVIPNPIQVCPAPDPAQARQTLRDRWDIPSASLLLLYAGRRARVKGLHHLLHALCHLRRAGLPAALAVVGGQGETGYALRLRRLSERLGVTQDVRWVERQEDLAAWYAAADLFVLPSLLEGASLAAGEALASGLPAVLTRVGDAEELAEATGGVVLLDPPQGSFLDIQPENHDWCLTAAFPKFHGQLAGAIEAAVGRLGDLRAAARESAGNLAAARSPQAVAKVVDAELHSLGIG